MHLAAELLMQKTGIRMVHIPYKGMGAAVQDLLAGNVQVTVDISTMAQVKQGKLKALGVAGPKRYPGAPNVPSFSEQGLDGLEITSWLSLHAPAGLPEDIQRRLNGDVNRVLSMSDVRERISAMSMDPVGGTPQQLTELLQAERMKYAPVIKAAGIKVE
jgi:tripartite-type tricarboxylate transporter receptor subunit TctC